MVRNGGWINQANYYVCGIITPAGRGLEHMPVRPEMERRTMRLAVRRLEHLNYSAT